MLRATANQLLPTTITGSLPRPSWYTENLGLKSFLEALVETAGPERDGELIRYFHRRTLRQESLLAPVMRELADAQIQMLD